MALFTDSFTGTAGQKLVARAGWAQLGSGNAANAPEIGAGNAVRTPAAVTDVPAVGNVKDGVDHYVQCAVNANFASGAAARNLILVRSANRNVYIGVSYSITESVWEYVTDLGRNGTYAAAIASGDIVRVEAQGTEVRVYINGVLRFTKTDTTHTAPNVGLLLRSTALAEGMVDGWESGEIGAADTTAPTLSAASATAVSHSAATGSITTDEDGPAWAVVTTSATKPEPLQVMAGLDHNGVGAAATDTALLVAGVNTDVFDFPGLTGSTTYYLHVVQDDEAATANTSLVDTSDSFTTPVPGVLGSVILALTGVGTDGTGFLYPDVQPGDEAKRFTYVITRMPTLGTFTQLNEDGTFVFTPFDYGNSVDTFEYEGFADGVSYGTEEITVGEATPVLVGSLNLDNLAHNAANFTIPVATGSVSVAYEYKLSTDSVWQDLATSRTIALTSLASATEYTVQARAYNSVGTRSAVLSYTFTTQTASLVTAVLSSLVVTNYGADTLALSVSSTVAADCYVSVTTTDTAPTHEEVITGVGAVLIDAVTLAVGPNPGVLTTSALPPGTYYVHVALGDGVTVISNVLTAGPLTVVAVTKFATLVLRDRAGALLLDLRGLLWAWWDTYPPNLHEAPVATGIASTSAVTGAMTVGVYGTGLPFGGVGTLAVLKGDGVVGSSLNRAFFGPVAINPEV